MIIDDQWVNIYKSVKGIIIIDTKIWKKSWHVPYQVPSHYPKTGAVSPIIRLSEWHPSECTNPDVFHSENLNLLSADATSSWFSCIISIECIHLFLCCIVKVGGSSVNTKTADALDPCVVWPLGLILIERSSQVLSSMRMTLHTQRRVIGWKYKPFLGWLGKNQQHLFE